MDAPTTWNEAVHQTACMVAERLDNQVSAELVGPMVEDLKGEFFDNPYEVNLEIVKDDYVSLAQDCLALWWKSNGSTAPFPVWAQAHLTQGAKLAISKQHDYGHDNILAFGHQGIVVRIHDKWARIQNLVGKGADPSNESLEDSFADIVNYCVIGIMLVDGTFTLELADV